MGLWTMVAEERRQTAGLLETLDDAQWGAPSLRRTFPADRAEPALDFLTTKKAKSFNPPGGIAGLRFVAADLDWAHGEGPEVRGDGEALLLTLDGRPQPLDELEGDGVDELRRRFT